MSVRRPIGVTVVAIALLTIGLLQLLTGALLLFGGVTAAGVAILLLGLVTLTVSVGLLGGSRVARLIVSLVLLLNIGSAIYTLIAHPSQLWSAVFALVFAITGLVLLFAPKATSYFEA